MNSSQPSPFQPLTPQTQPTRRARVKLAVFSVIALNVVFCMALLLTQGCKREAPPVVEPLPVDSLLTDTNMSAFTDTNVVVDPWATAGTNIATQVSAGQLPVTDPHLTGGLVSSVASTYIIKSGDTFDAIAKAGGTTAAAILAANPGVDPRRLKIGSTINLPAPSATTGVAPTMAEASGEVVYVVKSGDTLSRIATKHSTTVAAIKRLNNLATDRITVNQKLKIPVKAPAPADPLTAPTTVR